MNIKPFVATSFTFAICTSAIAAEPVASIPAVAPIRVVACDAIVKSAKRGICLNKMSEADFTAVSPSVSWWYNWHFEPTMTVPADAKMEFLPMAWGDRPADIAGLKKYLTTNKPSRVLALNEPNLKGQAFITPEQSAVFYKKVKAIADEHKVPVIGPHMSLGSATDDSITAFDPIDKKDVTYTFMTPYLKAFNHFMGDAEIPATASHTYGNVGELKWMTEMMYKEFKKPVWVTEFAQWGAKDEEAERDYLIQSVDFFERTPYVEGYAWFKERVEGNPKLSLLAESGKLTKLGETYVKMPVHDANVYYQLPGRLQAESYVRMENADITETKDGEGFLEMRTEAKSVLDFNVAVAKPTTFSLKLRFKSNDATKIELLSGDAVVASLSTKGTDWQTAATTIQLPAGNQTLRVRTSAWTHLNWMEFEVAN